MARSYVIFEGATRGQNLSAALAWNALVDASRGYPKRGKTSGKIRNDDLGKTERYSKPIESADGASFYCPIKDLAHISNAPAPPRIIDRETLISEGFVIIPEMDIP